MSQTLHYKFILQPALALALVLSAQHALAKRDLFNNPPHAQQQSAPAQQIIAPPAAEEETPEPAVSATDAALRAQQHVDGKVMNVRKFQDENKTLYGVKVLQKNGRMRTVNVDANSGSIIE